MLGGGHRFSCWFGKRRGSNREGGGKKPEREKIKISFLFWAYWIWQLASPRIMSEKTWNVSLDRRLTRISTVFLSIATVVESVFVDEVTPREPADGKRVLGPRPWNHHKTFQTQEPHRRGWKLCHPNQMWLTQKHRNQDAVPSLETAYAELYLKTADSGGMSGSPSFPNGERKGALSTAVGQQT